MSAKSHDISRRDIFMIIFGLLDAVAFVRLLPRLLYSVRFFYQENTLALCLTMFHCVLHISYALSAYAFLRRKNWSFVVYYCQFPLRLLFFSVSLGFLSCINKPFQSPVLHYSLGVIMLSAEIARLVITVILHKLAQDRKPTDQVV